MCGILITKDPQNSFYLRHRGLHDNIVELDDRWFLYHTVLPIQTRGDHDLCIQPIELARNHFLLYNGEIFNYDTSVFKSDVAYLKYHLKSSDYAPQFNWDGFWAIAIVEHGQVIVGTDPLGKKLLYYNDSGEISSEIKPLIKPRYNFDQKYFGDVYKFGYTIDNSTPFMEIKRLIPGDIRAKKLFSPRNIMLGAGDEVSKRHIISKIKPPTAIADHKEKNLRTLLEDSILKRLLNNNPEFKIYCLLSGGLDSTILAYLLKKNNADVTFVSIENNEREYVDLAAKALDLDVIYIPENQIEYDDIWITNETPVDLGSVTFQYNLFKKISQLDPNARIVISGDGSDELFGGYKRIHELDTQHSDIFSELSYYHLPRLDKMSMRFTLELRCPYLGNDVIKYALSLPYEKRKDKKVLKEAFKGLIPDKIIDRPKKALKIKAVDEDPKGYRKKCIENFKRIFSEQFAIRC